MLSDPVAEAFGLIHRHPSGENFWHGSCLIRMNHLFRRSVSLKSAAVLVGLPSFLNLGIKMNLIRLMAAAGKYCFPNDETRSVVVSTVVMRSPTFQCIAIGLTFFVKTALCGQANFSSLFFFLLQIRILKTNIYFISTLPYLFSSALYESKNL